MATLATLRSYLRSELKIDPNERVWSDSILNRAINDAVDQVQQDGDYNWHFNETENSESTVIDQAAYTLPSDFVRLELNSVTYDSSEIFKDDYNYLWKQGWFDTSGKPSKYALRGTSIYLALRPNEIKTLKYLYKSKLTAMVADADDSGLPDDFNLAVIKWAAYLAWSTIEGRENKGIAAAQDYQEAIKGLFAQYLGRRDEGDYQFNFELS